MKEYWFCKEEITFWFLFSGSEGHGIPRYIQDGCTKRVAIKSDSFFENSTDDAQSLQGLIGSLNVSSAAGLYCF